MLWKRVKNTVRHGIAAPGVRDGLRWFLHQDAIPQRWRDFAHRKLAKRARFANGKTFDYTNSDGVTLRFLHGGTSNYLYWLSEYERATTALFSELARDARVILDIGAADGLYAVFAAVANPDARIVAFEPGLDAAAVCERNIELNRPASRNVELHAFALGERDTESILYIAGETGGTSSLDPSFRQDRREQLARVRNGDAVLRELGIDHVDLIKIDTESTEPDVLRGMRDIIARSMPDIICEVLVGRTEHALEELLGGLGYTFYHISDSGLTRRTSLAGDASYRQPNFLFTRRSR
jgi:FkbM family methyltransferase